MSFKCHLSLRSARLLHTPGKITSSESFNILSGGEIDTTRDGRRRYLGLLQSLRSDHKDIRIWVTKEYHRRLDAILNTGSMEKIFSSDQHLCHTCSNLHLWGCQMAEYRDWESREGYSCDVDKIQGSPSEISGEAGVLAESYRWKGHDRYR